MIVMGLLGSAVCGLAFAEEGTNNQTMKPAIRFEIQELREKPVIDSDHPDCKDNKYGFEGGSVVKLEGVYHLFATEMAGDPFWVRMRIVHWTSPNGIEWKTD